MHSLGHFSDQHFRSFLNDFLLRGQKERLKEKRGDLDRSQGRRKVRESGWTSRNVVIIPLNMVK